LVKAESLRYPGRGEAPDRHHLGSAACTRHQGQFDSANPEPLRKKIKQGLIGCAINRLGCQPDLQLIAVQAGDLVAGRTGLHPDGDSGTVAADAEWGQ
jgi:hypothetical protein